MHKSHPWDLRGSSSPAPRPCPELHTKGGLSLYLALQCSLGPQNPHPQCKALHPGALASSSTHIPLRCSLSPHGACSGFRGTRHCAPVLSLRFLLVGSGYFLKQKMYANFRYHFLRGLILKGQSAIDLPSEGGECHTCQGWAPPLPATVSPLASCSRLCIWSFAHGGSAWQALPACCSARLGSPVPHRAS